MNTVQYDPHTYPLPSAFASFCLVSCAHLTQVWRSLLNLKKKKKSIAYNYKHLIFLLLFLKLKSLLLIHAVKIFCVPYTLNCPKNVAWKAKTKGNVTCLKDEAQVDLMRSCLILLGDWNERKYFLKKICNNTTSIVALQWEFAYWVNANVSLKIIYSWHGLGERFLCCLEQIKKQSCCRVNVLPPRYF